MLWSEISRTLGSEVMAQRGAAGKCFFSKHRQGFSLISLINKNITVCTSAHRQHASNKVKEEQVLVGSHVLLQDVDDLQGNAHFTITCECSAYPSQHSAAHRVVPDIQCRSSQTVGSTLSSHQIPSYTSALSSCDSGFTVASSDTDLLELQ